MKISKMITAICVCFLLCYAFSLSPVRGQDEEAGPSDGPIFVSIFWIGLSDKECAVRDSLIMDNAKDCEIEFARAENEIKQLVAKKNSRGGAAKWGVFEKCAQFPNSGSYNVRLGVLKKQCSGAS